MTKKLRIEEKAPESYIQLFGTALLPVAIDSLLVFELLCSMLVRHLVPDSTIQLFLYRGISPDRKKGLDLPISPSGTTV